MPEHNLVHLAGRLFNTPLYITPEKLEVIMGVLRPRLLGHGPLQMDSGSRWSRDMEMFRAAQNMPQAKAVAADQQMIAAGAGQSIAVLQVIGTLVHRSGWLDAESGLISYDTIRQQFRAAINDPAVAGIMLLMDSNGGEGAGLFDLADEIYNARGIKPIHAFVDERAYSAGYALASSASVINLTRTAGVGSIGVICQHTDQSEWNKQTGLTVTPIFAGARKNDFSPHQPLSNEARVILQKVVDDGYDIFTKTAARNRNLSVQAVRDTEAAFYMGEAAIAAGLADGIKTWDQAVEALISEARPTRKNGGTRMSQEVLAKQLTALFKGDEPETVTAALASLGYQPVANPEALASQAAANEQALAAAKKEGADEVTAKAAEIIGLCELAATPLMVGPLLKAGKSVEEARAEIVNAQADLSGKKPTTSTVGPGAGAGINYLVKDAEARAAAGKQ